MTEKSQNKVDTLTLGHPVELYWIACTGFPILLQTCFLVPRALASKNLVKVANNGGMLK